MGMLAKIITKTQIQRQFSPLKHNIYLSNEKNIWSIESFQSFCAHLKTNGHPWNLGPMSHKVTHFFGSRPWTIFSCAANSITSYNRTNTIFHQKLLSSLVREEEAQLADKPAQDHLQDFCYMWLATPRLTLIFGFPLSPYWLRGRDLVGKIPCWCKYQQKWMIFMKSCIRHSFTVPCRSIRPHVVFTIKFNTKCVVQKLL